MNNYVHIPVVDPTGVYYYSDDVLHQMIDDIHCRNAVLRKEAVCGDCGLILQSRLRTRHARWVQVVNRGLTRLLGELSEDAASNVVRQSQWW